MRIGRRTLLTGSVALGIAARAARAATALRWATVLPVSHPAVTMMERVAAELRSVTGGALSIESFPSGQLGSSRELIEAVSSGAIQMLDEGPAQFGQFVPVFSILEAPYIWREPAQIRRALGSDILPPMNGQLVAGLNMRVIGSTYYGTRHVTSGTRSVRGVADMRGFRLRIPEVDTYRAMAEAWGARPTPLGITELYLALREGAVDGQENPLPTIESLKLFEVQKHLMLTAHIITPRLITINETAWSELEPAEQSALSHAIAIHGQDQDQEIIRRENSLVEIFRAAGMIVEDVDVESFRGPVLASVPAKFESRWGKGLWQRVASA